LRSTGQDSWRQAVKIIVVDQAALLASREPIKSEVIKTHSGLIAAFTLYLIKPGRIPMQHGKSLRQVDQIRLLADYSDEEVERETALSAIEQADHFVGAVSRYLRNAPPAQIKSS
jgi:uncharacterized protein